jgi:hypothetical protein
MDNSIKKKGATNPGYRQGSTQEGATPLGVRHWEVNKAALRHSQGHQAQLGESLTTRSNTLTLATT